MDRAIQVIIIFCSLTYIQADQNVWSSAYFRHYFGKTISSITTLNSYTIKADSDAVCAFLCQAKGSDCFAAQYQQGSRLCSLQLNCGVVQLESDPTGSSSVYVRSTLVNENDAIRPYLSFPLAKGCNPSFANNYGVESVTTPPTLIGDVGEYNTMYPAFATTLWFPTTDYPTSSYVKIEDTKGKLDLLRSSFTLSYFVKVGSDIIMPVVAFFANSTELCFAFRLRNNAGTWIAYQKDCVCDQNFRRFAETDWAEVNGWSHILYSYEFARNRMFVYVNGAIAATYTEDLNFTTAAKIMLLGAVNTCSGIATNSLRGSMACLQFLNRTVTETEVLTLYAQCTNGVVYV